MKPSALKSLLRKCIPVQLRLFLPGAFLVIFASSGKAQTYFPPTFGMQWETINPSSLGWCQDSIDALYTYLETEQSDAFIVLKDGKIVLERFFGTYDVTSAQAWNSASKSLRAVLVGIAQEEGLIDIQNKTSDYLGQGWTNLPLNKEDLITVKDQLAMTSGLDELDFFCITPNCLNYVADAGTRWAYHNGPYLLLEDVIGSQSGVSFNVFTNTRLGQPIGMGGYWFTFLGNTTYVASARDMARFGWLVMNNGVWNGTTVLGDLNYINAMRTPSQALNPSYGYLWWLNGQSFYVNTAPTVVVPGMVSPNAPTDVYSAAGANGQFISISPSTGLIMIRQGAGTGNYTEFSLHDEIWKRIMNLDCTASLLASQGVEVKVYPNPSVGSFHVEFSEDQESVHIELRNTEGKLLLEIVRSATKTIDLHTALSPGVYFLSIETETGTTQQRVVID